MMMMMKVLIIGGCCEVLVCVLCGFEEVTAMGLRFWVGGGGERNICGRDGGCDFCGGCSGGFGVFVGVVVVLEMEVVIFVAILQ